MAGWIKMPLGKEVGLGPGDIVLDGGPTPPPQKKGARPQFSVHVHCGRPSQLLLSSLILTEVPFRLDDI